MKKEVIAWFKRYYPHLWKFAYSGKDKILYIHHPAIEEIVEFEKNNNFGNRTFKILFQEIVYLGSTF